MPPLQQNLLLQPLIVSGYWPKTSATGKLPSILRVDDQHHTGTQAVPNSTLHPLSQGSCDKRHPHRHTGDKHPQHLSHTSMAMLTRVAMHKTDQREGTTTRTVHGSYLLLISLNSQQGEQLAQHQPFAQPSACISCHSDRLRPRSLQHADMFACNTLKNRLHAHIASTSSLSAPSTAASHKPVPAWAG
jgi:hypothetical protein